MCGSAGGKGEREGGEMKDPVTGCTVSSINAFFLSMLLAKPVGKLEIS